MIRFVAGAVIVAIIGIMPPLFMNMGMKMQLEA